MKQTEWLLKNTVILAIGNILVKMVQFFLLPLYTAVLTTSEYAISDLFNNTVEIVLPILTLSITEAVFRFSMDRDTNREELLCNGIIVTFIGTIACALFCAPFNYIWGDVYPIWFFLPLFATVAFKQLLSHYVRAIEKVKEYAISSVVNAVTVVLFAFVFLTKLEWGIRGYLLSLICANLTSLIYLFFVLHGRLYIQRFAAHMKLLKQMLCYSVPLIANTISWWLTNTSSRYIVIAVCGAEKGGLFAAASKIPALMNVCINTFQQAWVMSAIKEYDGEKNIDFQSQVYKMYSGFIYVLSAIIILLTPLLGKFLLLGEFYSAWRYVPLLVVSATIGGLSSFFGAFYSAVKKNIMSMISTLAGGISNVVLCLVLTDRMGIYGALMASLVAYVLITVIRIVTTKKYAPIKVDWFKQAFTIALLILEAICMGEDRKVCFWVACAITLVLLLLYREMIFTAFQYMLDKLIRKKYDAGEK